MFQINFRAFFLCILITFPQSIIYKSGEIDHVFQFIDHYESLLLSYLILAYKNLIAIMRFDKYRQYIKYCCEWSVMHVVLL